MSVRCAVVKKSLPWRFNLLAGDDYAAAGNQRRCRAGSRSWGMARSCGELLQLVFRKDRATKSSQSATNACAFAVAALPSSCIWTLTPSPAVARRMATRSRRPSTTQATKPQMI